MFEKLNIIAVQVASLILEWVDRGAWRRRHCLSSVVLPFDEDQQMKITDGENSQNNARVDRGLTRSTPLRGVDREFHGHVTIQIQTATKPRGEMKSVTRSETGRSDRRCSPGRNLLEEEDVQLAKDCALNVNL